MPTKPVIRPERLPHDIKLNYESETIAEVVCNRCDSMIGRLQTVPAEPDADMEEIYAEIRLIAGEHRSACIAKATNSL
jgi:hypothetical protein